MFKFAVGFILFLLYYPMIDFKDDQLRYPRVREAYVQKWDQLQSKINNKGINSDGFRIYIRAFKKEEELEIWMTNAGEKKFKLLETFPFCRSSGVLGPKDKEGDLQIPEGCYLVDRFNPASKFHLSLGINYPNKADRKRSDANSLGGDIFIHGNCVTIGCIPISDDFIKELYVLAVEAKNSGQNKIPVHIFPGRFNAENWDSVVEANPHLESFWFQLKQIYSYFEYNKKIPNVHINEAGEYEI